MPKQPAQKDDSQVFDMMATSADETKVDLFSQEILNEIPAGTAVSKPEARMTVGQRKAAKSFDAFIKTVQTPVHNPTWVKRDKLSKPQIAKLREYWEASGKPIIKIHNMGDEVDGDRDDRAYYKADGMRSMISKQTRKEAKEFGGLRYGKTDSDTGVMTFPVMKETYFEIGERDGKEIVVDDKGNFYPDMKVPQWENSGRVLGWGRTREENVKYDPKTRKGVGGEILTHEFEAHKVVQDSLRKVYDETPSEKEIHEQYQRQLKRDSIKTQHQGDVFKYLKESEGSRI